MPRRPRSSPTSPRALLLLGGLALALFAAGEGVVTVRSDAGRLRLASIGLVDASEASRIVAREVRRGLTAMAVPAESVHVTHAHGGRPPERWQVGLSPGTSALQVNYAVTRCVEERGGRVFSGRETGRADGPSTVTLLVGYGRRETQEIVLLRPPPPAEGGGEPPARLALVVFGLPDGEDGLRAWLGLRVPFAVALVPGSRQANGRFRAAHDAKREIVLHVPLEPINYPRVNPGPATLLVTMRPAVVTGTLRRWIDQAEPVAAVSNLMGSLATQDMTVMTAVFRELRRRHLPFLHVQPAAGAVCRSLASDLGVVYDEPDAVLDYETRLHDARTLDRAWERVLAEARHHRSTTVWLRATDLSRRWLPKAAASKRLEGVDLVPLTALLRRPVVP